MNIVSRPWEPQDLLDDLQMYIDEEPDNYLNGRRTTLCMARDYLKAYFDTGLMPQQIRNAQETLQCFDNIGIKRGNEIVTAEEEGRLAIFPCKVGETVWFIRPLDIKKEITETTVEKLVVKGKGIFMKLACNAMYETSCNSIGKTVFLTREEAETALKGENHDA